MYYVYFHQTIPLMFAPMLSVQMSLFVKLSYRCDMIPSEKRSKKACELRSKVQLIRKWVFMMSIVSLFEKGTFIIKMYLWDFCPVHDICRLQITSLPQTADRRPQTAGHRRQTADWQGKFSQQHHHQQHNSPHIHTYTLYWLIPTGLFRVSVTLKQF